jgi:hypothetical protein
MSPDFNEVAPSLACLFARFVWSPAPGDRVMYMDQEQNREGIIKKVAPVKVTICGKEEYTTQWVDLAGGGGFYKKDLHFFPTEHQYFSILTAFGYPLGGKASVFHGDLGFVWVPTENGSSLCLQAENSEGLLSRILEARTINPAINDRTNEVVSKLRTGVAVEASPATG